MFEMHDGKLLCQPFFLLMCTELMEVRERRGGDLDIEIWMWIRVSVAMLMGFFS